MSDSTSEEMLQSQLSQRREQLESAMRNLQATKANLEAEHKARVARELKYEALLEDYTEANDRITALEFRLNTQTQRVSDVVLGVACYLLCESKLRSRLVFTHQCPQVTELEQENALLRAASGSGASSSDYGGALGGNAAGAGGGGGDDDLAAQLAAALEHRQQMRDDLTSAERRLIVAQSDVRGFLFSFVWSRFGELFFVLLLLFFFFCLMILPWLM